jgi:hypothetical protein
MRIVVPAVPSPDALSLRPGCHGYRHRNGFLEVGDMLMFRRDLTGRVVGRSAIEENVVRKSMLAIVGFTNIVFAVFQAVLAFSSAGASRYLGAPPWALAILEKGGPSVMALAASAVGISACAGVYALSGAGMVRRLPALRAVLLAIGCGYALWGLRLVPPVVLAWQHPSSVLPRFLIIRGAPLLMGVLVLAGTTGLQSRTVAGHRQDVAERRSEATPDGTRP